MMSLKDALNFCKTFPGFTLMFNEQSEHWEASYWPDNLEGTLTLGANESPELAIYEFVSATKGVTLVAN